MQDEGLTISSKQPLKLEPHQEWICNYLNRLNEKQKICSDGVLPSDLIKGALAASFNSEFNPDWMAQSAHSYREILYGLGGARDNGIFFKFKYIIFSFLNKMGVRNNIIFKFTQTSKKDRIKNLFHILHEQKRAQIIAHTLTKTHLAFTKISHHFTEKKSKETTIKIFKQLGIVVDPKKFPSASDFNNLIKVFENTIKESSLDPLGAHAKISSFIKTKNRDAAYLRLLFSLNFDTKRFFFSKADKTLLDWLWKQGFLNDIKKGADDSTIITYRMPELEYLACMAEMVPIEVVQIISSIEISETNLNPEVIDRFLWIINSLPADQIKNLTKKIRDEQWVFLMRSFNKSGYEFTKIVDSLFEAKESKAILELFQVILSVKSKDEIVKKGSVSASEDLFCIHDIYASGIFEALANIEESFAEEALQVSIAILERIVKMADVDKTNVFNFEALFALYDVDFFALEIEGRQNNSLRADIKNLVAVIKKLIERTIGTKCDDTSEAMRLFNSYIKDLPTNQSVWKLKLFTLAQCPEIFKDELRKAFFRLFEVENFYQIEGGTEYKKALKIGFSHLADPDQRDYVTNVFTYFSKKIKQDPDKIFIKRIGWEILSSICNSLNESELTKCESIFGSKCDAKFVPEPSIGIIRSGAVRHQPPVDISKLTISQITANLKSEWTPKKLDEQFDDEDFLRPRGAEGLGESLKEDIKVRTVDYIKSINSFFDRDAIDSYYLYSILRGLEEMLRNKQALSIEQTEILLDLFTLIEIEGKKNPFKKKVDKSWLADWIEVHKVMTDILLFVLENKVTKAEIHLAHRNQISNLVSYLLTIEDSPSNEDEKLEFGGPYGIAINSVRGRAFEAFVVFTENDGKQLAEDIKDIYKKVLTDDSLAVRLVIGRYLPTFYFRDKEFITQLILEIFPKNDPAKKDVYLATWEGYLSSTLYDKLFTQLDEFYKNAIDLDPKDYTDRKYSNNLDEFLAIHLALAFAHLDLKITDTLFEQFWDNDNVVRQKEFVSFIGRSCLTRSQAGDDWLRENKVSKEKLIEFWDWTLENDLEPEVLSGFGIWINPDKEILDDTIVVEKIADTLKKSDGDIGWDYGLLKRLPIFARINAERTLDIISSYLLDSKQNLNQHRCSVFGHQTEIKDALKIIYKQGNEPTKLALVNLINILIEKGSEMYWNLKEVLE